MDNRRKLFAAKFGGPQISDALFQRVGLAIRSFSIRLHEEKDGRIVIHKISLNSNVLSPNVALRFAAIL
jgi:hypothetical protein